MEAQPLVTCSYSNDGLRFLQINNWLGKHSWWSFRNTPSMTPWHKFNHQVSTNQSSVLRTDSTVNSFQSSGTKSETTFTYWVSSTNGSKVLHCCNTICSWDLFEIYLRLYRKLTVTQGRQTLENCPVVNKEDFWSLQKIRRKLVVYCEIISTC